jgi:hypothetical protein
MLRKLLLAGVCLSGIGASVTALAQSYEFRSTVEGLVSKASPPAGSATSSCKSILDSGNSVGSGIYTIQPASSAESFEVYCDMTSAGGGWTLVVAQFEVDPLKNWNEGTQTDYDPTLATRRSFTLSDVQLPSHQQTAFGKGLNSVFIDYANFTYSNGDLQKELLKGLRTGYEYHVARHAGGHFGGHNPEENFYVSGGDSYLWFNTLTFDRVGGRQRSWSFGPNGGADGEQRYPGYGMAGDHAYSTQDTYAWPVWVR